MSTPTDRTARVLALFDELVDLEAPARTARLAMLRAEDSTLAAELERMLAADSDGGLLDDGMGVLVATVAGKLGQESGASTDGATGRRVGPFILARLLGRGGMGEVWLAQRTDGDFRQQVALKLLKRGMDSDDLRRRFVQERRILAELSHPGIARFTDGGVGEDGAPWYAMEYVDGVPITEHARTRALGVRERIALIADVAEAVAYAQNRLVVHRDLKPSNILVDAQGRAHLLDFGIAKLLEADAELDATATGHRAMSPAYAAPEQILDQPISAATDVYSLGVVLYELLTGELPHKRSSANLEMLAAMVREESPERPSVRLRRSAGDPATTHGGDTATAQRFARTVSGELDTIVLTALRGEPQRRYPSAAAFADDLRRWLDGRPVSAQPDTATYRMRKFVTRHRFAVGSASAVLLALIAGFGTALWQANEAREQARLAAAEAVRAEREAEKSDRVAEFMASLLGAADPMARETTEVPTVGQVVALAAERVERDLADSPEVQAAVLAELSAIAFNGNDAATGTAYADRARKLIEALPAADPAVHASVDRVAGEALLRGGDPSAAERVFRAGLARIAGELAQPLPRRSVRIAAAQLENGLGVSLYMLIQHADAAAAFERSLQLQSGLYGVDSAQAGVQAYNLALVQVAAAQFDRAYTNIERSLAIHRARMSADDPRLAMVLSTKADILDQLDRTDEAIAITTEALRISERAHGVDAEQLVDPLETLGELHFMRGEFDIAEPFLLRGIGIARRAGGPRERFVLARSLGTMAMYRKRYAEAVSWFEEALAAGIERTSGQGAVPHVAAAMLAWARGLGGDTNAALAQLEQSRIGLAALPQPDPTDELVRRYYTGEVALRGARTELAIENLREALRLAAQNPPYDTSTFAAQSRIALGLALWAEPDARQEARGLIEEGIASMQRKSMGFHPLVASGREALAASP